MFNNGTIGFTGATTPPASPATVLGAENGLSVDSSSGSAKAVLGNDPGDLASPGKLLSNRQIVSQGSAWIIFLSDDAGAPVQEFSISPISLGFVDQSITPQGQSGLSATRVGVGTGGSVTGTLIEANALTGAALTISDKSLNIPTIGFLVFGSPSNKDFYLRNNNGVLEIVEGSAFGSRFSILLASGNTLLCQSSGNVLIASTTDIGGRLQFAAGSATAGTAPIKLRSGALNATPEIGAIEFLTDRLYIVKTTGSARETIAYLSDIPVVPTLASGTYTPTLTNVANVTSSTAHPCSYMRVGNVVTVFGTVTLTQTLSATLVQLGISLPVASNFTAATDLNGYGNGVNGFSREALGLPMIFADAANDRAELDFLVLGAGASGTIFFSFQYVVI